jgi:hypothetical protein
MQMLVSGKARRHRRKVHVRVSEGELMLGVTGNE